MKLILLLSVLLIGTVDASPRGEKSKECKQNELFYKYTTHYEASCENPEPKRKWSDDSVCRCDRESGFLRNTTTGECVEAADCIPPVKLCGENEIIDPCTLGCEPSCDNPEPTNCTQKCVSGCQCDRNFLRRGDNKCVHETQCRLPPTKCPENEFLDDCHSPCQEDKCSIWTGDGFHKKHWPCFLGCHKACSCIKGLFRNNEGRCVKEADCRPSGYECKQNETFRECQRGEPSCRRPNLLNSLNNGCEPGCKCIDGFLRTPQGECVKEEDCPYEDPKDKCKSLDCISGECFVHVGRPVCVQSNCFAFPCPSGSSCEELNGRLRCLTTVFDNKWKNESGTSKWCGEVRYANNTDPTMKQLCYERETHFLIPSVCHVYPCPKESTYVLYPKCTEPECSQVAKLESLETQALEGKQCKKINEIFSTCKKNCSDTKCNEKPEVCTEKCDGSGCVCQEGFFRDRFGDCVTQSDCVIQKDYMERLYKVYY